MSPRIDTLRQQIAHAQHVLTLVERELDTLHALAYERPTADSPERTSGAMPDWALDTHGDTTARAALRTLMNHTAKATTLIATGADKALSAIRDQTPAHIDNTRHRARITATEFLDALDAAERRRARGEYTPHRTTHQPVVAGTEAALRAQLKAAVKENDRLRRRLRKLETEKTDSRTDTTMVKTDPQ